MAEMKLAHLTRGDHLALAVLLNRAQDDLTAATEIVRRALYTDATLRVQRQLQEKLIDQLRAVCGEPNPYQSVGYWA